MTLVNYLISFINRWLGAFSEVVLAFLGLLICIAIIGALWDRRVQVLGGAGGIFLGFMLLFHNPILATLTGMQAADRIRGLLIGFSFCVIVVAGQACWRKAIGVQQAIIWISSFLILGIVGVSPDIVRPFQEALELSFTAMVCGILMVFLVLNAMHDSLAKSRLERKIDRLSSLIKEGCGPHDSNELTGIPESRTRGGGSFFHGMKEVFEKLCVSFAPKAQSRRKTRGTRLGAPALIVLAVLSVFAVGMMSPQPMVGDEVTHYYMLTKQADDLSQPNFYAHIPTQAGDSDIRRYPHSFVWHYLGAAFFFICGKSFVSIQIFQSFFLFQLLVVAYLLSESRGGVESRASLVYILSISTLPLVLIFSVVFYQDVPMTAQALTAFYLLDRRRWLLSACFISLALGMKVTAVLFFPAFFFILVARLIQYEKLLKGAWILAIALIIVLGSSWSLGKIVNIYGEAPFYPQERLETLTKNVVLKVKTTLTRDKSGVSKVDSGEVGGATAYSNVKTVETAPVIIANHPGDLRVKENYLIYGGLVIWLLLIVKLLSWVPGIKGLFGTHKHRSSLWLWTTGGSFLLFAGYFSRTAPDARFFLPALPFILLPVSERVVQIKRSKILIVLLASLALLQGSYVLLKTYNLRAVTSETHSVIEYFRLNPPSPKKIFMYPEGNYRLFPVQHDWYLGYRLKELWRGDNNYRLQMFSEYGVGAVVIKKHLIADVGDDIINLGVYPTSFVRDLERDSRFSNVFENGAYVVYAVPSGF